jgi:hypothetical protein
VARFITLCTNDNTKDFSNIASQLLMCFHLYDLYLPVQLRGQRSLSPGSRPTHGIAFFLKFCLFSWSKKYVILFSCLINRGYWMSVDSLLNLLKKLNKITGTLCQPSVGIIFIYSFSPRNLVMKLHDHNILIITTFCMSWILIILYIFDITGSASVTDSIKSPSKLRLQLIKQIKNYFHKVSIERFW